MQAQLSEQECHYSAKGGCKCVEEAVRVLLEARKVLLEVRKVLSELRERFLVAVGTFLRCRGCFCRGFESACKGQENIVKSGDHCNVSLCLICQQGLGQFFRYRPLLPIGWKTAVQCTITVNSIWE